MADARFRIGAWRDDYNHHRPHTSLGSSIPPRSRINSEEPESSQDAWAKLRVRTNLFRSSGTKFPASLRSFHSYHQGCPTSLPVLSGRPLR
ncbi:integrase core domain-containing protein [Aureimonas phyllosphaerae]|uniref:integrase core domain-containing protein n=1 Tax=Aureimonas phyllosphaerae TaxID=1166078 RepID=UPI000B859A7D